MTACPRFVFGCYCVPGRFREPRPLKRSGLLPLSIDMTRRVSGTGWSVVTSAKLQRINQRYEQEWAELVKDDLRRALPPLRFSMNAGYRLIYALDTKVAAANSLQLTGDRTDLLICERGGSNWVPRVMMEFKLGDVTSQNAATYSSNAETHKSVHPYLRYGIVIGGLEGQWQEGSSSLGTTSILLSLHRETSRRRIAGDWLGSPETK